MNLWIIVGGMLAVVAFGAVRGIRGGKRERQRLEALFERVKSCACPSCGKVYGNQVRPDYSMDDDHVLPARLAEVKQLLTWRITCPWCGAISLLAENERVFELLQWTSPKPEKPLSRFQTALIVLLAVAVIAAVILSMVRFFKG